MRRGPWCCCSDKGWRCRTGWVGVSAPVAPRTIPGTPQAADILVNYTYPIANQNPLELVATGVENLNEYAAWRKPVIADIEASSIDGLPRPTPHQLRAEVWMSLIHGAAGIQYFCHRMTPLNETDCLDDAETAAALSRINREIIELAPALNSQSYALDAESSNDAVPVRAVLKQLGSERYVFAAGMADGATTARFPLNGMPAPATVEVVGEGRSIDSTDGRVRRRFRAVRRAPLPLDAVRSQGPRGGGLRRQA